MNSIHNASTTTSISSSRHPSNSGYSLSPEPVSVDLSSALAHIEVSEQNAAAQNPTDTSLLASTTDQRLGQIEPHETEQPLAPRLNSERAAFNEVNREPLNVENVSNQPDSPTRRRRANDGQPPNPFVFESNRSHVQDEVSIHLLNAEDIDGELYLTPLSRRRAHDQHPNPLDTIHLERARSNNSRVGLMSRAARAASTVSRENSTIDRQASVNLEREQSIDHQVVELETYTLPLINIEIGQEAQTITHFLRTNEPTNFKVRFTKNGVLEPGDDANGLKRQALYKTFTALTDTQKTQSLFCKGQAGLRLNLQAFETIERPDDWPHLDQDARDFGLVLGAIHRTNMVVKNLINEYDLKKIHSSFEILSREADHSIPPIGTLRQKFAESFEVLDNQGLVELLLELDPSLAPQKNYLLEFNDTDTLKTQISEHIAYYEIASGFAFSKIDPRWIDDYKDFKSLLFGEGQLQSKMLQTLQVRAKTIQDTPMEPKLLDWIQKVIQSMTETECELLCCEITGTNSLGTGVEAIISFEISQEALNDHQFSFSHSCFRTMDINTNILRSMMEKPEKIGFELFKQSFMASISLSNESRFNSS